MDPKESVRPSGIATLFQDRADDRQNTGPAGALDTKSPVQNKRVLHILVLALLCFRQHRALRQGRCQAQRIVCHRPIVLSQSVDRVVRLFPEEPERAAKTAEDQK